jgi:C4-dicarboxylate transporter DctM subunit
MQVILLVGIFSGVFTATEAAAVSVVYAIGVEVLVFRALGWREVFDIARDSAISTGVIFILLAMGALLAFFITLSGLDQKVITLVRQVGVNWVVFMLIVNIVFLTCAMFLDPNSIMVIFLPTLFPIATALGIDPVHFGMVVTLNVCTGMITPPLGLDLAVAASTLNRPMEAVVAGIWPFIVTNVVVLILISYIPPLSTFLPKIFGV